MRNEAIKVLVAKWKAEAAIAYEAIEPDAYDRAGVYESCAAELEGVLALPPQEDAEVVIKRATARWVALDHAYRELVRLILDLQVHAKEQGWQDVDEPISALLAWTAPTPADGAPQDVLMNMPNETWDEWRLLKAIQSWGNSVVFVTYERINGRPTQSDQWLQDVGRRLIAAADALLTHRRARADGAPQEQEP